MDKKTLSVAFSLFMATVLCASQIPVFNTLAYADDLDKQAVLQEIGTSGYSEDAVVVKFKDSVESPSSQSVIDSSNAVKDTEEATPKKIADNTAVVELQDGASVVEAIVDLKEDPRVEYVEPDYTIELADETSFANDVNRLSGQTYSDTDSSIAGNSLSGSASVASKVEVNDPNVGQQWYISDENSKIKDAWDVAKCNNQVTVAIVDTGVDADNPELVNNIVGGRSFATDDTSDWNDTHGHGTAVAGVISAQTNNALDISGASYNANLLICRAFTGKTAPSSDIAAGIRWIIGVADQYNVKVINMSFGISKSQPKAIEEAINDAESAGILCVCASGNESNITDLASVDFPANLDNTVGVGAITSRHTRSYFSNVGESLDVVAPGSNIRTLSINSGEEVYEDGTSFSTPFVSAAAALCYSTNYHAKPSVIKGCLTSTAIDLGTSGKDDYYGYGQVDVYSAVVSAKSTKANNYKIFNPKDDSKIEHFKSRVFNGLLNKNSSVDVSDIGINVSNITFQNTSGQVLTGATALTAIIRSHPLFSTLCVDWNSLSLVTDGDIVSSVSVDSYMTTWKDDLISAFVDKYESFLENAPLNGSDVKKAAFVHDWICGNTTYSLQTINLPEFAIGCIANGKALCAGYSYAYQFLCEQIGLDCNYVAGTTNAGSHAWNKVKIDGQWFLVDSTWDGSFTSASNPNNFGHAYFLLNDEEFKEAGDGSHANDCDVTGNEPINNDWYFANKYWQDVRGPLSVEQLNQDPKLTKKDDSNPGENPSSSSLTRIFGLDCYGTNAATISNDIKENGLPNGVIVCGTSHYLDSLSAAALSGLLDCPVLLVNGTDDSMNENSLGALQELTNSSTNSLEIIVLGGKFAISEGIENELSAYDSDGVCKRIYGDDGYATNRAVYDFGASRGSWNSGEALVASGAGYHDALGAGSYAMANKAFILLVNPHGDNSAMVKKASHHEKATVLGGFFAVPQDVQNSLTASGIVTSRIAGDDAYQTNIAFVKYAVKQGMSLDGAGFSSGLGYYDALGSSHILGKSNSVMFLVSLDDSLNQPVYDMLKESGVSFTSGRVFGGEAVVSNTTKEAFENCIN